MRNIRISVQYDGTAYLGWQRQARRETIQEILEEGAGRILREPVSITGSGRTDAGVHALEQVANFKTSSLLPADEFLRAMNSILPRDIVLLKAEEVSLEFHARYDALSKEYQYRIHNSAIRSPFFDRYSWQVYVRLDSDMMSRAASVLCGRHDFSAFQSTGSDTKTSVRRVDRSEIVRQGDTIIYEIEGDGFLRHMVRAIAGTLFDVGRGKLAPDEVKQILESGDRSRAGATAPARGLFLKEVRYR